MSEIVWIFSSHLLNVKTNNLVLLKMCNNEFDNVTLTLKRPRCRDRGREREREKYIEREKERERMKFCYFVTFNLIISQVIFENFIAISQIIQKIWRFSLSLLFILMDLFFIFWYFVFAKNLMSSAYNRRCQQVFFTFNLLNNCMNLYW